MHQMFSGAVAFNQDLDSWGNRTGSAEDMSGMFEGSAIDATRHFPGWNIGSVTDFTNIFRNNTNLAGDAGTAWYNTLLTDWAPQVTADGTVTLTVCGAADTSGDSCAAGAPQYLVGAGEDARLGLIDYGWTVIDGGKSPLNVPDQIINVNTPEGEQPVGGTDTYVIWDAPPSNGSDLLQYRLYSIDKVTQDWAECAVIDITNQEGDNSTTCNGHSTNDYYFSVTATNAVGTSVPSEFEAPGNPGKPNAIVAGPGKVRVIPTPPTTGGGASSYTVAAVSEAWPFEAVGPTCTVEQRATSCLITGLDNDTAYRFTTTAWNWVGASPNSELIPSDAVTTGTGDVFVTTWNTTNTSPGSSGSKKIRLPLVADGTYNFVVSWGDGSSDVITAYNQAEVTHEYATRGTKEVSITGTLTGWRFDGSGDRLKLLDVGRWGPLNLGDGGGYFDGAANMTASATDALNLNGTANLDDAFNGASQFNADVTGWSVDDVTSMDSTFADTAFAGDVSGWNTLGVTDMRRLFAGTPFNADISAWVVSDVEDMSGMFDGAVNFDQDLSTWDVSQVTDMGSMFRGTAIDTSLDLTGWDISNVENFEFMLADNPNMTGVGTINWYNRLLHSWAQQDVQSGAPDSINFTACGSDAPVDPDGCPGNDFHDGGLQYYGATATADRQTLTDKGWKIVDGGGATANVPSPPANIRFERTPEDPTVATVRWDAAEDNGSPITGYTVTADPDEETCTGAGDATSCELTGLSDDLNYKYSVTVTATNGLGTSDPSDPYPMLRPARPGVPTAVAGVAKATVTVTPQRRAQARRQSRTPSGRTTDRPAMCWPRPIPSAAR